MAKKHMQEERVELQKSLSPLQVWALALGCIIGWGCFILPGVNFLPNAGPIAAFIGFMIGGLLLVFVALSYGKMIENYPVAGGEFAYAYVGFGPTASFICGWALVLGYLCIIALNGTALALLSRFMLPGVFEWGALYEIAGWQVYVGELVLVSVVLLAFGIANYRGVDFAGGAQLILAVLLVGGVVVLAGASLISESGSIDNLRPFFNETRAPLASVAAIVAIAPWLYVGFDTVPQAAEEFDFSPKKATKLMIIAILLGAFFYGVVTIAVAYVMPYKEMLALDPVWATGFIAEKTMGKAGAVVLAIAVLAAICTGINGFYIATTRLIFGMARANFLPSWFGKVHDKYGTPHNAVLFTIALVLVAPWFGREALDWVVSMSAVGTVIAYAFTSLAAYKFMRANPQLQGSKRSQIIAIIGTLSSLFCLGLLTIPGSPAQIAIESWYALVVWGSMGVIFFMAKKSTIYGMSVQECSYRILGAEDKPVFFGDDEAVASGKVAVSED